MSDYRKIKSLKNLEGYYWWRENNKQKGLVLFIRNGTIWRLGGSYGLDPSPGDGFLVGEFAGPVLTPEEMQKLYERLPDHTPLIKCPHCEYETEFLEDYNFKNLKDYVFCGMCREIAIYPYNGNPVG